MTSPDSTPSSAPSVDGPQGGDYEAHISAFTDAMEAIRRTAAAWGPEDPDDCDAVYQLEADAARDRIIWPHIEQVIEHGPRVIASIDDALQSETNRNPRTSMSLRRADEAITRLRVIRNGWQAELDQIDGPLATSLPARRVAEEMRGEDTWVQVERLNETGVLAIAQDQARAVAARDSAQDRQVQAARSRSTGLPAHPPAAPVPQAAQQPTPRRHSR